MKNEQEVNEEVIDYEKLQIDKFKKMNLEKMLYTAKEVSVILGVNMNVVYKLLNSGLLPHLKLGTKKIRKVALEKFLEDYEGMDISDPDNVVEIQ